MQQNDDDQSTGILQPAPKVSFGARLRTWFLTGLVVAVPIWVTAYVAIGFINFADNIVTVFIPPRYNPENILPFSVPGLGLVILGVLLVLTGFFTANFIGKRTLALGERLVERMPVVRTLYNGIKQIIDTLVNQSSSSFSEAVLVEYPRKGLWAVAFLTVETKGEVGDKTKAESGDDMVSLFLPTTPNPTSGFLLFAPRKDVIKLDMSVEDAAKLIISAGMVSPDTLPIAEEPEID